jgi:drug/metabolite transporter (DMT)-like permease
VSAVALPSIVRLRRARQPWKAGAVVRWGTATGLLGAAGNLLFMAANSIGQLTVAAVLAGLYPAVTVTFATIVLHERMNRPQQAGLAAAATSIVLIVTGA